MRRSLMSMRKLLRGAAAVSTCFALAACADSRGLGSGLGRAPVQSTRSGYYTDFVQVDRPVRGSSGSASSSNVQTIRGTVHDVDTQNGLFALDVEAGARVMVSMPYSPNRADMKRFQNLRQGDSVR